MAVVPMTHCCPELCWDRPGRGVVTITGEEACQSRERASLRVYQLHPTSGMNPFPKPRGESHSVSGFSATPYALGVVLLGLWAFRARAVRPEPLLALGATSPSLRGLTDFISSLSGSTRRLS